MDRRPLPENTAASAAFTQNMISRNGDGTEGPLPRFERGPQSVHTSDLFFDNKSNMYGQSSQTSQVPSNSPAQLYPYHQQAFVHQFSGPQQGYYGGQQQPTHWTPQPTPMKRPQSSSGAPPTLHHSFSARPISQPHRPAYRTQSLFGQPPPIDLPQAQSNPYINQPPPVPPLPPQPYIPQLTIQHTPPSHLFPQSLQAGPLPPKVEEEEVPLSPDSDPEELARAIAMSQTESNERHRLQERLINQEEQDLAKALAESLKVSPRQNSSYPGTVASSSHSQQPKPASPPSERHPIRVSTSGYVPPIQDGLATPTAHTSATSYSDSDYDFGLGNHRKWQIPSSYATPGLASTSIAGPSKPATTSHTRSSSVSSGSSLPYMLSSATEEHQNSLPDYIPASAHLTSSIAAMESLQQTDSAESRLVFDDEAYARQLALEEEQDLARLIENKARMEAERERQYDEALPPQYTTEGVLRPDVQSEDSHSSMAGPSSSSSSRPPHSPTHKSSSSKGSPYESRPSPVPMNSYASGSSSTSYSDTQSIQPNPNMPLHPHRPHSNSVTSAGPSGASQQPSSPAGLLNPNHFIDRELLVGVCGCYLFMICQLAHIYTSGWL